MWRLRATHPDVPRVKVPGGIWGMALVTLGPTAIIILAAVSQYVEEGLQSIGWALALMALGVVLYFPFRRWLKPGVPDVNPFVASGESD